ncbi:bifunctional unspecific monooxygenase/NADPH--hemo protein reductase [Microdochium bolleyi]|uniref:Bifunctional cytochrome P450/NADPH--P450 reductase n=1 Tax=Microdochium bolleyi TaxID=196109 RepID=A0A136J9M9_9PEZI|nr:bifunctional unspecific monooxygenase/NADPH--hemo protein reductase [Microdochium bolleyi]
MGEIVPIPEPPGYPIIGVLADIDREFPLGTWTALADKYGEIYRAKIGPRSVVFCSSFALVDELCDEKRFVKIPMSALQQVRNGVNDGLFTARPDEPAWGIAHRILMPAFGPMGIRNMFDEMHDISTQLCMKFARHGPAHKIQASDDFTRLALDTLALCTMGFRFNSYYTDTMHPFVEAMGDFLKESGKRVQRPPLPNFFFRNEDAKYWEDIELLRNTADKVLQERKEARARGDEHVRKDLLTAMLDGVDSRTGQKMSDSSIIDNLVTFLIAGHETTSGLLSFAMYSLLKKPEYYRKAQEEVDRVCGKGPITVDQMTKLPYIEAILRETLRHQSPIPMIQVVPKEDEILGGKWEVKKGEPCTMFIKKMHSDPAVYGEDSLEFKPERMLSENFNKLPKNAWKPFGNGMRACIGRPFAWQEAVLCMAMMLQNFNFVMDDPNYNLVYKQTLTIKPSNFYMRAIIRDGLTPTELEHRLAGTKLPSEQQRSAAGSAQATSAASGTKGKPMTVLYGSNSGTCEAMAHRIAADAAQHGFQVTTLDCLDTANGSLPKDQPVVLITASYEGQPPDNAAHFVSWLENAKANELEGVSYVVFGCGHHDWASTFHRIPKLVNEKLAEAGASRLADMGLADAAEGDMFADFETWEDETLWPALRDKYKVTTDDSKHSHISALRVNVTKPRVSTLREDVQEAEVVATRTLTAPGEPVKKHIEIKLPSDVTYRSGDYLAVLPINPKETVSRAIRRFELPWDANITIEGDSLIPLPKNESVPVQSIFGAYVELSQPATRRNIISLSEASTEEGDKKALEKLASDDYKSEISEKRVSILDLLERFPAVRLPLGSFLGMLPPMRVRQYSISSSPLWNASHVTLTFSVLQAPSKAGDDRTHIGVASSYLDSLEVGDRLHVSVRTSHAAFHLPTDLEKTPVIMVGAGTGLAPLRGFVQERAAMISAGRKVAPAVLYYGCREPGKDDLYSEELAKWESEGAVSVKRAYSRVPEKSGGNKYIQDVIWADREYASELWNNEAKLFVCGSRQLGEGVAEVARRIGKAVAEKKGKETTDEKVAEWWENLRNVRYATDVFD